MDYHFPELSYLTLRVLLKAKEAATLPPIKGSMLRGAFGHALRQTVCAARVATECRTCLLKSACVYTRIFETLIQGVPPPLLRGLPTSPRPFIIDVAEERTDFAAGETIAFRITLIGNAIEFYPYVIYSLVRMAENGLSSRRHRFSVAQVDALTAVELDGSETWRQIYRETEQTLATDAAPLFLQNDGKYAGPLSLLFLTPTRLKINNDLVISFTFHQLVFKMIRRVLEMAYFYQTDAPVDWQFQALLQAADEIEILERNLQWVDWHRYSNRQKTDMKLGGFTGKLTIDGNLAPFSHLLRLSRLLHVGKGATFGLGKMEMEIDDNYSKMKG
ncbi:MAG TPA: CRISPR system precrRNA processing endoribonuclease RAMP protein Cas6 [bacterium]|nr:CRISPR system precrRNA processing endoribonuclease RAMP protein Cas6 [bacterium]HPG46046.1 CRISPR system precrRNA processing endoribonuclease RAMP protein Cas6 [bacterium]HPM97868.1 CRISPR system precrRNA processing endoribonuclease RAMP protein Cas6 [bacterium]